MSVIIAPLVIKSIAKLVVAENSNAILASMAKKSAPPQPWQVEDAKRLRVLFESNAKLSQLKFGAEYGIGSQSMVWQYLTAMRPLNIDAAVRFAKGLNIAINEFSPVIAAEIEAAYRLTEAGRNPTGKISEAFERLTQAQKRAVATMIESYLPDQQKSGSSPTTDNQVVVKNQRSRSSS